MTAPAFTPGPWVAHPFASGELRLVHSHDPLKPRIATVCYADGSRSTHDANAHLIAASPEMFEALEKCRDKFREYEGVHTLKLRDYKGKEPLNYAAEIQFKINRNREMADMCDATLAKARGDQ